MIYQAVSVGGVYQEPADRVKRRVMCKECQGQNWSRGECGCVCVGGCVNGDMCGVCVCECVSEGTCTSAHACMFALCCRQRTARGRQRTSGAKEHPPPFAGGCVHGWVKVCEQGERWRWGSQNTPAFLHFLMVDATVFSFP